MGIGWRPGEWGVGDIGEGRVKRGGGRGGAQHKDEKPETACTQAVFVFSQINKGTGCRMEINNPPLD